MGQGAEQVLTQPYEPCQPRSNSRKTAYPELTGEVAMVGAPLDTTRADRGGAAAPVDRGGVLRRLLRSAGEPKSVTNIADRFHTADTATKPGPISTTESASIGAGQSGAYFQAG